MQRGFTLIELMIVVVIIGILSAIAIPGYNNVQESARRSSCRSNIRTLATAESIYFGVYGSYTADMTSLLAVQENAGQVRCPARPAIGIYTLQLPAAEQYLVACPVPGMDHGSFVSGISSW